MKSRKVNKKKKVVIQKTRKEKRKEKRQEKKVNRAQYHGQKKKLPGQFVINPELKVQTVVKKNLQSPKNNEKLMMQEKEKARKQQLIVAEKAKKRKNQLLRDNEQEDRVIQQMEKKLKLNKRKSKSTPKSFAVDGLDYLLDFCNDENRQLAVETEKQLLGEDANSDFEEDLAMVMGKDDNKNKEKNLQVFSDDNSHSDTEIEQENQQSDQDSNIDDVNSDDENFDEESDTFGDENSNDSDENKGEESSKYYKKHDKSQKTSRRKDEKIKTTSGETLTIYNEKSNEIDKDTDNEEDCPEEDSGNIVINSASAGENSEEEIWEDIYGRKRDKSGNIVATAAKYIPPAARLKQLVEQSMQEKEKIQRLEKQLKGLINRLAEHNMHTIANEIDELYMSNSRNNMNELLFKLIMESIVSPVITPDRLISEHMMLIAILHANVGTEIGAHFLLSLVKKIDEMIKTQQEVVNKQLDNIILMLSHLYNFKVFGCKLLYEILEKLCEKFTEKEIEVILIMLKTVGFALRKDDPLALKELIIKLQKRAASTVHSANSRIQFMLDVLLAIKNNNMNKIPHYNPLHVEHLKKLLKTFLRKGNAVTQFNISLDDLLKVDERGKWWIVGSAWTGNIDSTKFNNKIDYSGQPLYSEKILDLARKQRMNTDVRRNIFCILMTAEDYMDAFEKIHHLALKDQQAREIIYVLIDCCIQEKKFNPYYAVLAQKFCDFDRKNQMTLQYSLWDKLKSLDDYSNVQLGNLAKFLSHLFLNKGLPLSVLKVVAFGELDKPTMRLIRQIMLSLLLHENTEECLQVFERISISAQLQTFREGLRLFISHFMLKNADTKPLPHDQVQMLTSRAGLVDKILLSRALRTIL